MPADPPVAYKLVVTREAEDDILEIGRWLEGEVGRETADIWIDRLVAAGQTLRTFPERGSVVGVLARTGEAAVRQSPAGPYRLLYEVAGDSVTILAVVHVRRDLRAALEHRLLRPGRAG